MDEKNASTLNIQNITKRFDQKTVLKNVSFTVSQGSIHGLLGHNGSGKTTLFRIILGFLHTEHGTTGIFNHHLENTPGIKAQIGYVSENLGLYSSMTVKANLLRFCKLWGITDCDEVVGHLIEEFNLYEYADTQVSKLSAGWKQRVALARALMTEPKLLILDEFMQHIDPSWRHRLKSMVKDLQRKNVTILMATHILADVEELCDDVTIIKEGELLYTGGLEPLYQKTKLGPLVARISTNDNTKAIRILSTYAITLEAKTLIVGINNREDISYIVELLVSQGVHVFEAHILKPSLETLYANLYKEETA